MRVLWTWSGVAALVLGVIVWGLIFWCCIRYRKRERRAAAADEVQPRRSRSSASIFPFIVIAGLFYRTVVVEDDVNTLQRNPDVRVQVDAFKWNWQFEYQTYRRQTDAEQARPSTVYRGSTDPHERRATTASRRCYLSTVGSHNEIPVLVHPGQPDGAVRRALRGRHPLVLGAGVPVQARRHPVRHRRLDNGSRDNQFEFTATTTGSFVGRCAELCGTYHSQMNFEVAWSSRRPCSRSYLDALKHDRPERPGPAGQGADDGQAMAAVRHHHLPVRHRPHRTRGIARHRGS